MGKNKVGGGSRGEVKLDGISQPPPNIHDAGETPVPMTQRETAASPQQFNRTGISGYCPVNYGLNG